MNIFFLDLDPKKCAKYHCDKHISKMFLEAVQLLWSVWILTGNKATFEVKAIPIKPYKLISNKNHPVAIWCRIHKNNYIYLTKLATELSKEYTLRYKRVHACHSHLEWLKENIPECNSTDFYKDDQILACVNIPDGCTDVPLAVPICYMYDDLIYSYREYYKGDKRRFAKWNYSTIPDWFEL